MISSVAIIGKPNVGKSSIFNKLTSSRSAIVSNFSGVTKDRNIGYLKTSTKKKYLIIDTGGIGETEDDLQNSISAQAWFAAEDSDLVLFVIDGSIELSSEDLEILSKLRKSNIDFRVVINKVDIKKQSAAKNDLTKKGIKEFIHISAEHSIGFNELINTIKSSIKPTIETLSESHSIQVAVIGRPNSGKSTFINSVTKDNRVIVSNTPGTTIDSIDVPFKLDEQNFTLIDTAGIRKKNKKGSNIEFFSYVKTIEAISRSHIALVFIDADQNLVDQDFKILNLAKLEGKPIILVINKIDLISKSNEKKLFEDLNYKNPILKNIQIVKISALHSKGLHYLFKVVNETNIRAESSFTTSRLNKLLDEAISKINQPSKKGKSIKLRYINFGGKYPTTFIIHSNFSNSQIPNHLRRYLINFFYEKLDLKGIELSLLFKKGNNPFEGKKNKLTDRQIKKKKRLMKFTKKSKK